MKILGMFILILGMSGCAMHSENIQRNCKQIGDGPFSSCEPYPWYNRAQCERFK